MFLKKEEEKNLTLRERFVKDLKEELQKVDFERNLEVLRKKLIKEIEKNRL